MANPAIEKLIEILDNDLPRSTLFQRKVPALAEAFHADQHETDLAGSTALALAEGRIPLWNVFLEKRFICRTISSICNTS